MIHKLYPLQDAPGHGEGGPEEGTLAEERAVDSTHPEPRPGCGGRHSGQQAVQGVSHGFSLLSAHRATSNKVEHAMAKSSLRHGWRSVVMGLGFRVNLVLCRSGVLI